MKRVILASGSRYYQNYCIDETEQGSCEVYDSMHRLLQIFDTYEEAAHFIDDMNSGAAELEPLHHDVRSKKQASCTYSKIAKGEVDLSGVHTVYILGYGNRYYSSHGLVSYKDSQMRVFLDKGTAKNVQNRTHSNYSLISLQLTSNHKFPN